MKCYSYNKFFEVFANSTRLKIVETLYESPKNVTDICKAVREEQSKVSHNLSILHACHFVSRQKDGKNRIYSLNQQTITPIMKMVDDHVKKHCNQGCTNERIS